MNIKRRTFEILERSDPEDQLSKYVDITIVTLILLNVLFLILETSSQLSYFNEFFFKFEIFSLIIFTIEYILRMWSCNSDPRYKGAIIGRLKFGTMVMPMIDLLAILPFYLPMLIGMDLRSLRAARLFRLFRIFKLGRYTTSLKLLNRVMKSKKEELFMTLFIISILLIMISSVMYFVETDAQPEEFSSIIETMWWGVATITTVGYGDVFPITPIGRFLASLVSILGIGMLALPTAILGAGFMEELHKERLKNRDKKGHCPHCGRNIKKR